MKKLLLTTGIIFILIFNTQAQEDKNFIKNKTTFGVKGGLNTSKISAIDKTNSYNEIELYLSLFSETRFNKKWSFQNEVLFSYTNSYNYLEFPFLLKYHINNRWSVFVGPKLDFILNQDSEFSPFSEFREDHFKTLGVSGVIGTEYKISKRFFIEAAYNLSFTRQIFTINSHSINRRTFRIGLGYRF